MKKLTVIILSVVLLLGACPLYAYSIENTVNNVSENNVSTLTGSTTAATEETMTDPVEEKTEPQTEPKTEPSDETEPLPETEPTQETIPNNVSVNGLELNFVENENGWSVDSYHGTSEEVIIPDEIRSFPVTRIGVNAFSNNTVIKKVVIPQSVSVFPGGCFSNCSALQEVVLPENGMTNIVSGMFAYCTSLKRITLPSTISEIGDKAFIGSGLSEISIPDSVRGIGERAFESCVKLRYVTIGKGIQSIYKSAFLFCDRIQYVYTDDLAHWCGIQFYNDFSNPLLYAEYFVVNGEKVIDLVIPDSVTSVSDYAFNYAMNIRSVKLGRNCSSIGIGAFWNCYELVSADFSDSNLVTIMKGAFNGCRQLSKVDFGTKLRTIGDYAFTLCHNLKEIRLPETLSVINYNVYLGCNEDGDRLNGSVIYGYEGTVAQSYAESHYITFVAVSDNQPDTVPVTEPEPAISLSAVSLNAGEIRTLKVINGKVKSWKSSDSKTVTVKSGKLTALKKGKATITAELKTGKKLTCKVTVTSSPKLSKKTVSIKKGKKATVKLIGKAEAIKNKYTNTKTAKITSKATAAALAVKGLKKGVTTLKIKVNGVITLKLKVKVK